MKRPPRCILGHLNPQILALIRDAAEEGLEPLSRVIARQHWEDTDTQSRAGPLVAVRKLPLSQFQGEHLVRVQSRAKAGMIAFQQARPEPGHVGAEVCLGANAKLSQFNAGEQAARHSELAQELCLLVAP